jgi:endonuclease YncB( thermonuclease family)
MHGRHARVVAAVIGAATLGLALAPSSDATTSRADHQGTVGGSYTDIPIQETGRVVAAIDGDTLLFVEDGGTIEERIRLLGVNTPEVTGYNNIHFDKNMCGGIAAWHQLQAILPSGTRAQLRAGTHASANRGRPLRYVFAFNPTTQQYDIDVQAQIASSGLAMWFALDEEAALSLPYRVLVAEAQASGRGLWSPSYCGPVEQPDARLSVVVSWDAPGIDNLNPNGEFVVVRNIGATAVDLSGWLLRDSSLTSWFYFAPGTVLPPADFRVIHVGVWANGSPDPRDLYMNSAEPLFPNTNESMYLGDGAYLLDRSTAIRFYDEYPCLANCTDPLLGKVVISRVNAKSRAKAVATRANEEYVIVKNIGKTPALLDGYYLRRTASTYPFMVNTLLNPGQTITVRVGRGVATPTTQFWGQPSTLLNDTKDAVQLLSNKNVLLSDVHWTKPTKSGLHP